MSSSAWTSNQKRNSQNWADEVIAAAMKTASEEAKNSEEKPNFRNNEDDFEKTDTDDEGIVSDESPPSSSHDEIAIKQKETGGETSENVHKKKDRSHKKSCDSSKEKSIVSKIKHREKVCLNFDTENISSLITKNLYSFTTKCSQTTLIPLEIESKRCLKSLICNFRLKTTYCKIFIDEYLLCFDFSSKI